MNKPMIVSDEYREGYWAFMSDISTNPYDFNTEQYDDWKAGWLTCQLEWAELIGA